MYIKTKSRQPGLLTLLLSATIVVITGLPLQVMSAAVLEEVLVTATRRGETDIQVTPISVTALSEDMLDKMLINDFGDMAAAVPNLVTGNAPAFKSFNPSLRGVGKDGIILYVESPVGVSLDDFVLMSSQTQNLEPFDIESIEVLRGPQGTLFGKNTTAGVINVKTKKPELNNRSIDVRGSYAEFDSYDTKFAANYGAETFAFRATGAYQYSDGYLKAGKSSATYDPAVAFGTGDFSPVTFANANPNKRLAGDDVFSGRFKALWAPNDDFEARLTYEIIRDNGESMVTVNETPSIGVFPAIGFPGVTSGDPIKQSGVTSRTDTAFNVDKQGNQVDVDGYYLAMDWEVGNFTIHSLTGYREQQSRLASTYMGEHYGSLFDATRDDDRETFQQEIRIDAKVGDRFNYVVGGFLQTDKTKFCVTQILGLIDFFGPTADPLNQTLIASGLAPLADGTYTNNPSVLCNRQKTKAMALFADATFDFTDRLQLGFGVRQSYENKKWAGRPQTLFQFLDGTGVPDETLLASLGEPLDASDFGRFPFNVVNEEQSWTDPSFRVTGGYSINDDMYTWLTYAHSVKSGAFNDQTGTFTAGLPFSFDNPKQLQPIDPEFADSIEIGLKMDLFNNSVRLNIVYFDVNYSDAQRQLNATFALPGGGSFQETLFFNAAELDARGIEFEGSWAVNENLTISGNWSWQDVTFSKFEADTNFDGIIDVDLSGQAVNRSPEWTAYVMATYEHSLGDLANASHTVSLSFVDDTIFTYSDLGSDFDAYADNRSLLNWSTTFSDKNDKYFIRAFGKNLFDERYRTGNLAVAALWTMASYGPPRQFGVELGAHFDF